MPENVFIYGALNFKETQIRVIGRMVDGTPDKLPGYRLDKIMVDGIAHNIVVKDEKGTVEGIMIQVTKEELNKIDDYKTGAYKRGRVILTSGKMAWVYHK